MYSKSGIFSFYRRGEHGREVLCFNRVNVFKLGKEVEISAFPGGLVVKSPPDTAGTQVQSLLQEDLMRLGATELCTTTTEPTLLSPGCNSEAWMPRTCATQQEKPLQWEPCTPQLESNPHSSQLEKACSQQWRPNYVSKWINKPFLKVKSNNRYIL